MTTVYEVTTEFAAHADALALRDIIWELGYEARVTHRQLEAGPRTPCRETRLGKIILRYMTPGIQGSSRSFTVEDISAYIETQDYKAVSASPALSMLVAQGDIKRIADGVYRLIMPIEQAS